MEWRVDATHHDGIAERWFTRNCRRCRGACAGVGTNAAVARGVKKPRNPMRASIYSHARLIFLGFSGLGINVGRILFHRF